MRALFRTGSVRGTVCRAAPQRSRSAAIALLVADHYLHMDHWDHLFGAGPARPDLRRPGHSNRFRPPECPQQALNRIRKRTSISLTSSDPPRTQSSRLTSTAKVTAWNEGAHNLYGYSAEEAIDRRLTDLTIPAERSKELGATFRRVISGGWQEFESERITKSEKESGFRAGPFRSGTARETSSACRSAPTT